MTQELSNEIRMLSVYATMKDGNLEPLFVALSPEVVWKATAPKEFFRFDGTHRGIVGMKEVTALLFSRYHFTRFKPRIVTAKREQALGMFEAEALREPIGRYVQFDVSVHRTVKDGKITEHQCFFDTAGVLIQQGDLVVKAA
jgi:ketosteroid isomerase-like protein